MVLKSCYHRQFKRFLHIFIYIIHNYFLFSSSYDLVQQLTTWKPTNTNLKVHFGKIILQRQKLKPKSGHPKRKKKCFNKYVIKIRSQTCSVICKWEKNKNIKWKVSFPHHQSLQILEKRTMLTVLNQNKTRSTKLILLPTPRFNFEKLLSILFYCRPCAICK